MRISRRVAGIAGAGILVAIIGALGLGIVPRPAFALTDRRADMASLTPSDGLRRRGRHA